MLRVAVVGTSCSGKTTLARKIAQANGIPHIELDSLFWGPNWTPLPIEDFRELVKNAVAAQSWVVDGNYSSVRDVIWPRATHLVWLNLPFTVVFWRALSRTVKRVITQEELFAANRETARLAFFDRDSILWWVIRTHHRRRREYKALLSGGYYPHLEVYEVRDGEDEKDVINWIALP